MAVNWKQYAYTKGSDAGLDRDFAEAEARVKVKPGKQAIFRKSGLRWRRLPVSEIQRVFRRVEPFYGKLYCGGRSFFIERLVLVC